VNKHSGAVNGDSGHYPKTFTIGRNPCSRQTGIGVHDPPELPFTVDRNTHSSSSSFMRAIMEVSMPPNLARHW
jgi:hypothetical protein